MAAKKNIKVGFRKLGREGAHGLAWFDENKIEIDSRLKKKILLETFIHEALHLLDKDMPEEIVINRSKKLTDFLWKQGYRKIEI